MSSELRVDEIVPRTGGGQVNVNGVNIPEDLALPTITEGDLSQELLDRIDAPKMGTPFNYKFVASYTSFDLAVTANQWYDTDFSWSYTPISSTSNIYFRVSGQPVFSNKSGKDRTGKVCISSGGVAYGEAFIGRQMTGESTGSNPSYMSYSRTVQVPNTGATVDGVVQVMNTSASTTPGVSWYDSEVEMFEVEQTGSYELVDRQESMDKAMKELEARMKELTKKLKEVESTPVPASSIIEKECK